MSHNVALMRQKSGVRAESRLCLAFTLLEVVVALAVFSVAVIVLTQSFMNGLLCKESLKKEDPYARDVLFVRQHILTTQERKKIEEGGSLNLAGGGKADWQATISATDITDLFCVEWTVTFENADSTNEEEESVERTEKLYLLRPAWSDSIERSKLLEEKRIKLERWRSERMRS